MVGAKKVSKKATTDGKSVKSGDTPKSTTKKKAQVTKPVVPVKSDSEESSEESSTDKVSKATAAAKITSTSTESSGDSSDSDSSPAVKAAKKSAATAAVKAKPIAKKTTAKGSDSSDSSDDDEEEIAKPANGATKKTPSSDSSDEASSDEETGKVAQITTSKKVKPSTKEVTKGAAKKAPSSDNSDESSSEEETGNGAQITSEATSKEAKSSTSDESDEKEDVEMAEPAPPATAKGKRKTEDDQGGPAKKTKITTEQGASTTLFVGQLSWNVDDDWLATEFADAGEVVSARVQMDRQSGRSRGFGYVEFATAEQAKVALETLQGKEIDGRAVKLDISVPRQPNPVARAKQFGDVPSQPSTTLFIGNISWNTNEDMLWEHFGQFGEVSSVRVSTDRETGKPKGFAYVEFGDLESAGKGYKGSAGAEIDGRNIRVDYSQPRDSSGGGGGGRGGGDRGGGRGGGDRRGGGRGGRGGGRGGDRGGWSGGRGGGRGGRGGRGMPRGGGARTGGIAEFAGRKKTFD